MSINLKVGIIFLGTFGFNMLFAQTDRVTCIQNLSRGQRLYEQGELLKVIALVEDCASGNRLEKNQLEEAHRLLVLCYIFLDKKTRAEEQYEALLRVNPNYVPDADTEPVELVQLHNSFRVSPIATFGVVLGGNLSTPILNTNSKEAFKSDGLRDSNRSSSARFGTQFGVMGELQPYPNLAINAKFLASSIQYQFSETLFDGETLTFRELQNWLELPIALRYYIGRKNKFRIFIEAGLVARLLQKSTASVERLVINGTDVTGPDLDVSNARVKTNYAYHFGFGFRRSFGNILLSGNLAFRYDASQQVDVGNRYSNQELLFRYGYVDENFRILTPSLSIGISYAIYRHKVMKSKRYRS